MAKEMEYIVRLEAFEGPLDLLLHLIKKNEVDIYDIPIAVITDQYLEYLRLMKVLNLDIASEYLVMAATLLHIKSRMLLPLPPIGEGGEEEEGEEEDPRAELVQRLIEYRSFKEAAQHLDRQDLLDRDVFVRAGGEWDDGEGRGIEGIGLFDLIEAFRAVVQRWQEEPSLDVTVDRLSINDRIHWIAEVLMEREEGMAFQDLFERCNGRGEVIVTFLALLEMIRQRMVRAHQAVPYGTIWISPIQTEPGSAVSMSFPD